ncbi:MAG: hypothetical protein IT376_12590 [Polyangiaceae bacterium]|nr:hypothetical protein [Polyangiaceae bacterium]
MKRALDGFYAFMDEPLYLGSRPILFLLMVPLVIGLVQPLWHIEMSAPQYPKGLSLQVYSYTLVGGHGGADIKEINILNHYIGMQKLERSMFTELDWMPFGFGALGLLLVRVAALGNVRALVDLAVLIAYFGGFSLFRFGHKMWAYGHDLSPDAPIQVAPFMPAIWGHKQIGNFATHAYPGTGTYWLTVFAVGVLLVAAYHLVLGRLRARRAAAATGGSEPAAS